MADYKIYFTNTGHITGILNTNDSDYSTIQSDYESSISYDSSRDVTSSLDFDYIFFNCSMDSDGVTLLDSASSERTSQQNLKRVRSVRKSQYPDIGDQLDALYRDLAANKLNADSSEFYSLIKAVKDANPK